MARVAVVTGGASGIGRATVERLLRADWAVVLADMNAERGAAVVRELGGERLSFVAADVSNEADVAGLVAHARGTYGRLDCMVNNAGVGGAFGPLTELHVDDWDYTFAVVVRGGLLHRGPRLVPLGLRRTAPGYAFPGKSPGTAPRL